MAEIFLEISGSLSNAVLDFYGKNQFLYNFLIVAYGVILAVAHNNLRTIERWLSARYGMEEWADVLEAFSRDPDEELEATLKHQVRFSVVASPYFFTLYRINRSNLIKVLGKKHTLPRSKIVELLEAELKRPARDNTHE